MRNTFDEAMAPKISPKIFCQRLSHGTIGTYPRSPLIPFGYMLPLSVICQACADSQRCELGWLLSVRNPNSFMLDRKERMSVMRSSCSDGSQRVSAGISTTQDFCKYTTHLRRNIWEQGISKPFFCG